MLPLPIILVSLAILATAAYTDIKTLEVPDWLNYSGIATGIGINLIFSAQNWSYWPILSSIIGLAIGYAIACLMFYTGQWGGGDAKLLMAMGALIGFDANKFGFGSSFLIDLVFIGGAWGLVWTAYLAIKNRKIFWRTFRAIGKKRPYSYLRIAALFCAVLLVAASFKFPQVDLELLALALLIYFTALLFVFMKSAELSVMHKWVTPDMLTEGDWLIHTVKVGKQKVEPSKLGLEKSQLKILQELHDEGKLGKVLVKYGVPFTPAFLFAFAAALVWGNIILAAIF